MSDTVTGSGREAVVRVFRGDANGGQEVEYRVPIEPGMRSRSGWLKHATGEVSDRP